MSLLSHQSAVNLDKNYWAKTHKGISSLSQVVPNPLPYGERQNFETDTTGTISSYIEAYGASNLLNFASQGIVFSDVNTGDETIILNPSAFGFQPTSLGVSTGIACARVYLDPGVGNDTAIDIVNRNTNNDQIGIYTIRSNKDNVGAYLASTLTLIAPAGAEPTFSADFTGGLTVPNLFVSTINGAPPQAGSQVVILPSTVVVGAAPGLPQVFFTTPTQINSFYECAMSGRVSWVGSTPASNDILSVNFFGGSSQLVDNLQLQYFPKLYDDAGLPFADFAISGVVQTSLGSGSNIQAEVQAACGTPSNYTFQVGNGFVKFIKPQ